MAKPKYIVVHRPDENNVGDMASNPLQYFMSPDEYQVVDIDVVHAEYYPSDIPLIVGGGGLIGNENFGENMRDCLYSNDRAQLMDIWAKNWRASASPNVELREEFTRKLQVLVKEYLDKIDNSTAPRIVWGAGHNEETNKRMKGFAYPHWMVDFDLVGIRDYGQAYNWTPCASCMHPAFDKHYKVKNDIIVFEHKKQLLKPTAYGSSPIPRFVNSGNNMEQTIELLGSANTIVTNSYHGAYWGTLLGKKVIVLEPWSSKFYGLKHKPFMVNKGLGWESGVEEAQQYPDALQECRLKTKEFWSQVRQL